MGHRGSARRTAVILAMAGWGSGCTSGGFSTSADILPEGTWGGANAGVIVSDATTHVHIGCTLGDLPGPIRLDASGRFSLDGEYILRAYPIQMGPPQPARYAGRVSGRRLTLLVTVNDTTEKRTVTLGPVVVELGRVPELGPCPICRKP